MTPHSLTSIGVIFHHLQSFPRAKRSPVQRSTPKENQQIPAELKNVEDFYSKRLLLHGSAAD